jgi:Protein of unknown function (DUF1254)
MATVPKTPAPERAPVTPISRGKAVPVTAENFIRAESDMYLDVVAIKSIIRMNRDTLYSAGVFDFDAGPVTITLPEAGADAHSLRRSSAPDMLWLASELSFSQRSWHSPGLSLV